MCATAAPAASADIPFCSSCSILPTERAIRPPYTSSPAADFLRAAVNPVRMSPGMTAHTDTPKGRTSPKSASVKALIAALDAE